MVLANLITPELGLFFWQTVVFLIVLFVLSKFAWGPIMTALKERETSIADALDSAAKARKDILELQSNNEALLAEARSERDRIIRDAQTAATALVEEARSKAQSEGNRMIESAKSAIQTEKQAALTEIKNHSATLAVEIAEKILRKELENPDAQQKLVNEYIKEVNLN